MLRIAMSYKHDWRLQAYRVRKTVTEPWRHSLMIQRSRRMPHSHSCTLLTPVGPANPQHPWGSNPLPCVTPRPALWLRPAGWPCPQQLGVLTVSTEWNFTFGEQCPQRSASASFWQGKHYKKEWRWKCKIKDLSLDVVLRLCVYRTKQQNPPFQSLGLKPQHFFWRKYHLIARRRHPAATAKAN